MQTRTEHRHAPHIAPPAYGQLIAAVIGALVSVAIALTAQDLLTMLLGGCCLVLFVVMAVFGHRRADAGPLQHEQASTASEAHAVAVHSLWSDVREVVEGLGLDGEVQNLAQHAGILVRLVANALDAMDRATVLAKSSGNQVKDGAVAVAGIETAIEELAQHIEHSSAVFAELQAKANQIGDIVATIHQIARQTDLLAVNAAIEASRAGATGRGFAVVAHEVKALAARTNEASNQVSTWASALAASCQSAGERVGDASKATENGRARIHASREAMQGIQTGAQKRVAIVSEVVEALRQQEVLGNQLTHDIQSLAEKVDVVKKVP